MELLVFNLENFGNIVTVENNGNETSEYGIQWNQYFEYWKTKKMYGMKRCGNNCFSM